MQIDRDVVGWLHNYRIGTELKSWFNQFADLYDKKYLGIYGRLWHQLTTALEKFAALPQAATHLVPLYENFVVDWEKKMNRISFVQFLSLVAAQKAHEFLLSHCAKLSEKTDAQDAFALLTMQTAHYKLLAGDLNGCKDAIKQTEKILESLPSHTVVNATFYRVSADYYKTILAYPQYYHNALLYLSSINIDDLTVNVKQERAYDLSISALLGDGLYNFGELLMHPILDSLADSPLAWLRNLLFAFNGGDLEAFEKISKSGEFLKQQLLMASMPFLSQKLCLMTLVEIIFKRSKQARGRIPFLDISKETRVPLDQVEHLLMKSLSLGLVKGLIDESSSMFLVTWVQPRILSTSQITTIRDRLTEWSSGVNQQVVGLENEDSFKSIFVQ